jgi:DnaJ-domain-containing protein 1
MTEKKEQRRVRRYPLDCDATLKWHDSQGQLRFLQARALDVSESGVRIEASEPIEARTRLQVWIEQYRTSGDAVVRHCTHRGHCYVLGMEFSSVEGGVKFDGKEGFVDYYELLQVSPNAEAETIHRIHRLLAARYHPDNVETGNEERFLLLNEAYSTLSDPEKRLAYDTKHQLVQTQALPVFEMKEFVDGVEGEANRRMGILSLLYQRRRQNSDDPGFSLLEFETLMGFPREHLEFAIWFLKGKQQIQVAENSDYVITTAGVELLESHISSSPVLRKLLQSPSPRPTGREQERKAAPAE